MNHKVLLADDSLTIQKVIKITLANQPYAITDCSTDEELFRKVSELKPALVLLDFNLSEKFTGYELTTKIKSAHPACKVLLLLGTFDSVDDAAMEKCGASDKIVKPFDSNKFIAICKQLIDTTADTPELKVPEKTAAPTPAPTPTPVVAAPPVAIEEPEDQWTMSSSAAVETTPVDEIELDNSIPINVNALQKEIEEWGMSVPPRIEETGSEVIAPVAAPELPKAAPKTEEKYETRFPETDDLDYPVMEEKKPVYQKAQDLYVIEDEPMSLELEGSYVEDTTDVKNIEAQIRDEVEEDLWQVDEFEDLKKEVSSKMEEVKNNFQPTRNAFDESLFGPLDADESIDWAEPLKQTASELPSAPVFNKEEVRAEIEEMVKKYVKEYMDELFQQKVEKVTWEVVPDLAENLIRQELSKISSRILEE
jgi:DNA-binding response OmpR family regulator